MLGTSASNQSIDSIIQWHAVRVAILGNEISTVLRLGPQASHEALRYLARQLESWQRELPQEMQLQTFLSSPNGARFSIQHQQALLVTHIFYLGAVILLYGQPLVTAEHTGGDVYTSEMLHHRHTCLVAGEQISQLLNAVNGSQACAPRSWLVM